ncbi:PQQ-like beta-propeller repeat protein [Blastopirellula sp. JC732]|uniref:PQQ-like beta-propeller repeat protein n=1 Tax=Blastopirellula sediminis TaxID=2894196 RepID=A0A9X1MMP7_9BACT|nr:PQQ-binding-like beta-propeller repeat protein [Blastopirellula sediminis]MCC9608914.1 PQQ-like beta-propeller repeat protein [Blastopirellula sediminis]MCC9628309.1 PQQ-like beta-propeller repeat protein [Blastopirellula sediminis]
MLKRLLGDVFVVLIALACQTSLVGQETLPLWNQWRGPQRDAVVQGPAWPSSLNEQTLKRSWRVELPPSYSGPVVSDSAIFVTGTENNEFEVAYALDRESGKELWKTKWPGAMTVPFFAAANGSWIRSTPAFDGESLYVAGMRDVLVSLNAQTGEEQWRVDFVEQLKTPLPSFGFASSPLLDGDSLYVQAGASFIKLEKATGKIVWRVLIDDGGMMGSAFSSPTIATLAGKRQLVVQTREKLVGVDPENGALLWEHEVPSFRGMNILTPTPFEDGVFTSSYQNKSWLFTVTQTDGKFTCDETWSNNAAGYMSTPVVIAGHAYLHLQNQRFTCIDLRTGERQWTSQPYGKYCSLVAQDDQILALDERGLLLLLRANPEKFELLDERKVSEDEAWAHLAISGNDVIVRDLNAVNLFRWQANEE